MIKKVIHSIKINERLTLDVVYLPEVVEMRKKDYAGVFLSDPLLEHTVHTSNLIVEVLNEVDKDEYLRLCRVAIHLNIPGVGTSSSHGIDYMSQERLWYFSDFMDNVATLPRDEGIGLIYQFTKVFHNYCVKHNFSCVDLDWFKDLGEALKELEAKYPEIIAQIGEIKLEETEKIIF
jgi:hypothetical protein